MTDRPPRPSAGAVPGRSRPRPALRTDPVYSPCASPPAGSAVTPDTHLTAGYRDVTSRSVPVRVHPDASGQLVTVRRCCFAEPAPMQMGGNGIDGLQDWASWRGTVASLTPSFCLVPRRSAYWAGTPPKHQSQPSANDQLVAACQPHVSDFAMRITSSLARIRCRYWDTSWIPLGRCNGLHTCADIPMFRGLTSLRAVGGVREMGVATQMPKYRSCAGLSSWALWQARTRLVVAVLAVDVAAGVMSLAVLLGSTITASDLLRFGLLAAMSVVYLELSRQVEHRRRLVVGSDAPHIDVSSVWLLSGAIVLPTGLAALLAAMAMLHLWLRSWSRVDGLKLYRITYSGAA